ncbi:MAG: regulatory protein RecX [Chromatiales bacterium]|nr:regulatory protein RecX [Chromatiales bacterium]
MPKSPWPKRKRSTKRESDVGAASAATPLPPETRGLDSGGSGVAAEAAPAPRRATCRKSALDILARREHSVAELREKLAARGFDAEEVEITLAALMDDRLLSEDRFVENFVGSHTRRGHGPVWLRAELERRGIASSQVTETLASMDVDWVEAAETVRRKRFGAKVPADFKEQARQARFLQYRGFTAEQARAVLRKVPDT